VTSAAEDGLDAVVELGAGLAGVYMLLLAPEDLGQVGLGREAQRYVLWSLGQPILASEITL